MKLQSIQIKRDGTARPEAIAGWRNYALHNPLIGSSALCCAQLKWSFRWQSIPPQTLCFSSLSSTATSSLAYFYHFSCFVLLSLCPAFTLPWLGLTALVECFKILKMIIDVWLLFYCSWLYDVTFRETLVELFEKFQSTLFGKVSFKRDP